jgi:hypothetical protein
MSGLIERLVVLMYSQESPADGEVIKQAIEELLRLRATLPRPTLWDGQPHAATDTVWIEAGQCNPAPTWHACEKCNGTGSGSGCLEQGGRLAGLCPECCGHKGWYR